MRQTKDSISFYASTRSYAPVMNTHGWNDTAQKLYRMSVDGHWDQMGEQVTDDMLEAFAVVGTYDDITPGSGRQGQYRVRLMNNHHRWDCAYPGVEVLPDGVFVVTTYGHWTPDEEPYIVSVRFTLEELDKKARDLEGHAN